jgi:hypothetical protein
VAETAQIIRLADVRAANTSAGRTVSDVVEVVVTRESFEKPGLPVEFDDLYPAEDESLVRTVRRVLLENEARFRSARDGDDVDRDDAVSRLKVDLATIFALKDLAPGLEIVVVALYHALRNKHSAALSISQYNDVLSVIRDLVGAPQLPVEGALDLVERMHTGGLNTDLAEADVLHEMICD